MFSKARHKLQKPVFFSSFLMLPELLTLHIFFHDDKYPCCPDSTSTFNEGHRVDVNSGVRSTEHKAPDMDLNVVIVHPYLVLEIEIQTIFYQRTSILYVRKGGKRQGVGHIGL